MFRKQDNSGSTIVDLNNDNTIDSGLLHRQNDKNNTDGGHLNPQL